MGILLKKRGNLKSNLVVLAVRQNHLGLADLEGLVVVVEDGRVGSGGADEADALRVGRQFGGTLAADGVAGVKDGRAGDGAEHAQILKRHLRRTVLADRDARVRAHAVDVGLRDGAHAQLNSNREKNRHS